MSSRAYTQSKWMIQFRLEAAGSVIGRAARFAGGRWREQGPNWKLVCKVNYLWLRWAPLARRWERVCGVCVCRWKPGSLGNNDIIWRHRQAEKATYTDKDTRVNTQFLQPWFWKYFFYSFSQWKKIRNKDYEMNQTIQLQNESDDHNKWSIKSILILGKTEAQWIKPLTTEL